MRRPARQFRSQWSELEQRWLLSTALAPTHLHKVWDKTMELVNSNGVALGDALNAQPTQVATQQDGAAIVHLHRSVVLEWRTWSPTPTTPSLPFQQVRVTTGPYSPAVGVNVAPVDQIVTFAPGQTDAFLSVPILAGAPNPGVVDVALNLTPIDPTPDSAWLLGGSGSSLDLKIGASEAQVPPSIVAAHQTRRGVMLTFDKPMDPAGASNVNNYRVNSHGIGLGGTPPTDTVYKLKAARYDPATDTVTLVAPGAPGAPFLNVSSSGSRIHGGPRSRRNVGPPLADVEGNLISQGQNPPGNFDLGPLGFS